MTRHPLLLTLILALLPTLAHAETLDKKWLECTHDNECFMLGKCDGAINSRYLVDGVKAQRDSTCANTQAGGIAHCINKICTFVPSPGKAK